MLTPSISHSRLAPRQVQPIALSAKDLADSGITGLRALEKIGIGFEPGYLRASSAAASMDSAMDAWMPSAVPNPVGVTTASIVTPIQFLQNWLPGFIRVLTAARKIDELIGIETIGNWKDEWVVQGIIEPQGAIDIYKDASNVPLSTWNPNWEQRTIVRFESGVMVGRLEQARASSAMINSDAEKRASSVLQLEIWRNLVGFYGFNEGSNNTYGLLNDPQLPAYITVANGASGSGSWASKTFNEITQDIITAMNQLRTQSQANVDPRKILTTIAVPTDVVEQLSKVNELGSLDVWAWLEKTYPKARVVDAPQFDDANGGDNVFFIWADHVEDGGTDDKRTWAQIVPVKFMALGVEQRVKSYIEDFTNATAGTFLKRPYAVVAYSGI